MGFKKTSEGRVFFNSTDDTANDEPESRAHDQNQVQILTLLKALNERLKMTQTERNKMRKQLETYRYLIEDLANKSDQGHQALQNTQNRALRAEKLASEVIRELEETRKLLHEVEEKAQRAGIGVSSLKNVQKEQAEKMAQATSGYASLVKRVKETETRQEDFNRKIEETGAQQARLMRKIDQAVEDRARFMRKIERIEETVIQTRDSLNAKAMVLLTDQAMTQTTLESAGSMSPGQTHTSGAQPGKIRGFWKNPAESRATVMTVLIGAILLAGFGLLSNIVMKADLPDVSALVPEKISALNPQENQAEEGVSAGEEAATASSRWTIESGDEALSSFSETPAVETADTRAQPLKDDTANDIGAIDLADDQQLLQLLDENPEALASRLNDIEPGLAEEMSSLGAETPAAGEEPYQQARLTPPDQSVKEKPVKIEKPVSGPVPPEYLKPDPTLPDSIRQVETKAFEGSAEAQHDLAAVYTAGHGGAQQDYGRAVYWFEKAADQGIANASYNLGVLYHQGLGVPADINKAIYWYENAAQLGHPEASYNLGIAYIEGIGVNYAPEKAAIHFEEAAEKGVMEAAYNLGLIYENGLLGEPRPDEALMWYKTAADRGSPEAKAALEQLAKNLDIGLDEVNELTETMMATRKAKMPDAGSPAYTKPAAKKPETVSGEQDKAQMRSDDGAAAFVPVTTPENQRQSREQLLTAEIQEYLMHMGLYPGPADGVAGPLTNDAIKSYQSLYNFPADGQPSQELLAHMVKTAGAESSDDLGSRAE